MRRIPARTGSAQPVLMSDKVRRVVEKAVAILREKFQPGDRFWTIDQVARHCRVSRVTANLGIRELVNQGVLISQRGQGIFVLRRPEAPGAETPHGSLDHVFGYGVGPRMATTIRVGAPDFPLAGHFYTALLNELSRQVPFTLFRGETCRPATDGAWDEEEIPDVIVTDVWTLRRMAESGLLMELSPWIEYDRHIDLEAFFPEPVRDLTWSGKRFALPFCLSLDLLFTRHPKPAAHLSVKELLAMKPPKGCYAVNVPVPAHWLQGCGVPVDPEGWFNLTHPSLRSGLEAYAALYRSPSTLPTGLFTHEGLSARDAFAKSRLHYYTTGSFRLYELRQENPGTLRALRFDPSLCPKIARATIGVAMKASTPEPKIAWTALRALVSEPSQIEYGKFGANVPAIETAARHPNFLGANGGDWSSVPDLVKESVNTADKRLNNADYLRLVLAAGLRPYLEGRISLDECIARIKREQDLMRAVSAAA